MPPIVYELRKTILEGIPVGAIRPEHTENAHFYRHVTSDRLLASVTTKTSILSRAYYKQMAADYAVEYINEHYERFITNQRDAVSAEAAKHHGTKLEEAGNVGTAGHDIIERYTKDWIETGIKPESIHRFVQHGTDARSISVARSAEAFIHDHNVFPVAAELKVWDAHYGYAGTLDNISLVGTVYKGREGKEDCAHEWAQAGQKKYQTACIACGRELKLKLALLDWKSSNVIMGFGKFGKYEYAMQVGAYRYALEKLTGLKPKIVWIVRLSKDRAEYEIGIVHNWKKSFSVYTKCSDIYDFANSQEQPILPLFTKTKILI